MIPTDRFAISLSVAALMIGFSGWFRPLMPIGITLAALTVVLTAADWLSLIRAGKLEITRTVDEKLSLGAPNLIRLKLRNPSYSRRIGFIRDEYPEDFPTTDNVIPINLAPRSEAECAYHVTPPYRGDFTFGNIYVRLFGPFRFLTQQIRYSVEKHVKVYPNLLDMRRYEIGLKRERAIQPGQRIVRAHGRGTDFESLRDYFPDDEFRSVDWKASARRSRLVTRQYQQERSQNIMIAFDCGRIMGPVIDGLTRLDHSINAAMMLAHVAAIKGDKVGMIAFAEDVIKYSPPKPGKSQTLNLLSMTYNLQDASGDSDYYRAFPFLARKWTRRSLIVIFTELVDPESSKPLISQISSLTKKHLCMCVAMADPAVMQAAYSTPQTSDEAFRTAAARQVLQARKLAAAQLLRAGAIVVDVAPGQFTPAVVNEYLQVKSTARL